MGISRNSTPVARASSRADAKVCAVVPGPGIVKGAKSGRRQIQEFEGIEAHEIREARIQPAGQPDHQPLGFGPHARAAPGRWPGWRESPGPGRSVPTRPPARTAASDSFAQGGRAPAEPRRQPRWVATVADFGRRWCSAPARVRNRWVSISAVTLEPASSKRVDSASSRPFSATTRWPPKTTSLVGLRGSGARVDVGGNGPRALGTHEIPAVVRLRHQFRAGGQVEHDLRTRQREVRTRRIRCPEVLADLDAECGAAELEHQVGSKRKAAPAHRRHPWQCRRRRRTSASRRTLRSSAGRSSAPRRQPGHCGTRRHSSQYGRRAATTAHRPPERVRRSHVPPRQVPRAWALRRSVVANRSSQV